MPAPRRNVLAGYRPLGGRSRRYQPVGGGPSISRYQYDSLRARQAGFSNRGELERFRREISGSKWISDIYANQGRPPTMEQYALIREVRERRAAITPARGARNDQNDPALVAANGPLAQLLAATGRRPLSGRPVGSS